MMGNFTSVACGGESLSSWEAVTMGPGTKEEHKGHTSSDPVPSMKSHLLVSASAQECHQIVSPGVG